MTLNIEYEDATSTNNINAPAPTSKITIDRSDKRAEQAKVWEASQTKTEAATAPITKKDVAGEASDDEVAPLPDRALVAPDLGEFLRSKAPAITNPIQEQAERLEQALNQIQTPEPAPMSFEDAIMAKIEGLETGLLQRDQKQAEEKAQREYDTKINTFRTKIVENIRSAKESYPAIISLGREDAVATELVAALERGEDVSEDDIASEIEKGLWTMYESMTPLSGKPSKEKTKPSAKPTTPAPANEPEFNLNSYRDKRAAQAALWNKVVRPEQ